MVAPSSKDFSYTLASNRFGTLQHMVFITGKLSSGSDAEELKKIPLRPEKPINSLKMTADKLSNLSDRYK